ncbi:hypothetical protein PV08_05995 [Exophiala spinifera]|uniref:Uncharacterized protein n=1 Tax=Exophiala spinifera TaxID=91928 RepID=A0A0D2BBH7_9EURO|nr:uncharacterized protein PV08_05995 [Exophiala spinifera]KIW15945.1 hypothetical protein PV08_05995 [Exophiala spinifera]
MSIFSVIISSVPHGVTGGIMLDSRNSRMLIAWRSGKLGFPPLSTAVSKSGHPHELKTIRRRRQRVRFKELKNDDIQLMNLARAARVLNVEEIVDLKDTRKVLCRWPNKISSCRSGWLAERRARSMIR